MKTYKIEKTRNGNATFFEGTLEELTKVFSYTLECGHSWNNKIQTKPKTIKSLIKFINMSFEEKREYSNSVREVA